MAEPLVLFEELIGPLTRESNDAQTFPAPYFLRFWQAGRELLFVATAHSNKVTSPTFLLIRGLFESRSFNAVVLEGFPAEMGASPPALLKAFQDDGEDGFYRNGEWGYTAALASKKGIPFFGGEPTDKEILDALLAAGYAPEDHIGTVFMCYAPQINRDGTLKEKTIQQVYDQLTACERANAGLDASVLPDYPSFLKWHQEKLRRDFDPHPTDYEAVRPQEDGDFVQRICAKSNILRNLSIARQITRQLNERDKVLAVFGSGHLVVLRKALESMLGKPVEESATLSGQSSAW